MRTLKLTAVGDATGVVLPPELLEKLRVAGSLPTVAQIESELAGAEVAEPGTA